MRLFKRLLKALGLTVVIIAGILAVAAGIVLIGAYPWLLGPILAVALYVVMYQYVKTGEDES